jgi:hypothetical protein
MKVGDKIVYRGFLTDIFYEDLDGDVWFEDKSKFYESTEGDNIIRSLEHRDGELPFHYSAYEYLTIDVLEFIENGKMYTFADDYEKECYKKIKLTKLARKIYNIPDNFKGDLYVLEGK